MISSKVFKIKIADFDISVTIDNSFTANSQQFDSVSISSIKGMHCHALHELFFVGDSSLIVLTEDKPIEYKNCIVCIPPLFNHNSIRRNDYRILFSFSQNENKRSDFSLFAQELFSSEKPVSTKADSTLGLYIEELATLIHLTDSFSDEIAVSLLKLIFYHIYKCNANIKERNTIEAKDSYLITIDQVLNNYQSDINLQTVAAALNLSTKQTSRIIRKNYKTTLSDLVTRKRLGVACALLANSDMAVTDIAEHINFSSESYFYSQFKKTYGCTPQNYRKNKQSNI